MGNGTSTGPRRYTTYGTRDVRETAEYSNWPELAGAKLAESSGKGRNSYSIRSLFLENCRQTGVEWLKRRICSFPDVIIVSF